MWREADSTLSCVDGSSSSASNTDRSHCSDLVLRMVYCLTQHDLALETHGISISIHHTGLLHTIQSLLPPPSKLSFTISTSWPRSFYKSICYHQSALPLRPTSKQAHAIMPSSKHNITNSLHDPTHRSPAPSPSPTRIYFDKLRRLGLQDRFSGRNRTRQQRGEVEVEEKQNEESWRVKAYAAQKNNDRDKRYASNGRFDGGLYG